MFKIKSAYFISIILIALSLFVDNIYELKEAGLFNHSVYFYYFNSVVFSGAVGLNLSAAACVFPYFYNKMKAKKMGLRCVLAEYKRAVFGAGLCLGFGYLLFIAMLLPFFPFATEELSYSGFSEAYPYVKSLYEGGGVFLAAVFVNAFMSGVIFGGFAYIAYSLDFGICGMMLVPVLLRLFWPLIYNDLHINPAFRLDLWLKMKMVYVNEISTIGLSVLRVILLSLILSISSYFLQKKERRST